MRILFCNIAWMDYYKGIVPGKDEPKNGGSYVKDTKDAHEKYNFKPELLKLKGFPEGEYCLGFVETKSTSAGKRNQLNIEKIEGCSDLKNDTEVDKDKAEEINLYLGKILKDNLFSEKLVKGARDCFIGKRAAIKLYANQDTKEIRIMFLPSLEFIYESDEENPNELKKIIFFYQTNKEVEKDKQRIWKQKYEMIDGRCILNEGIYNGNGILIEPINVDVDLQLSGIPCYVIINDGLSGDPFGESDVKELLDNSIQ